MIKQKSKGLLYFLSYFVLVFGALAFFKQDIFKGLIMLLSVFLFNKYVHKLNTKVLWVVLFLIIVISIQSIMWEGDAFLLLITIIYIGILPYLLLEVIGVNYPKFLVNIIYYYAIVSLVFWGLTNISPEFHDFTKGLASTLGTHPIDPDKLFAGKPEQFILYTYESSTYFNIVRNPGPFHEPGAFAVFLIFAIVFNMMIRQTFLEKKNIVLILALLTTFSTAGYLALMVLLLFYPLIDKRTNRLLSIALLGIILPLIIYTYFNVDIFGDKIEAQYETAQDKDLDTPTTGRFLGARKSIYVLSKYPLSGRGLLSITRADISSPEAAGYGFMSFASRIGILGIIVYFFFFFKSLKQYSIYYRYNEKFAYVAFLALLMVLFSQTYAETPIFMMLFFASFIYGNFGVKSRNKHLYNE